MGKLIKKKIKTTHIYNGTTFNFRISGATNSHLLSLLSSLNFIHQFDHHSKNPETITCNLEPIVINGMDTQEEL